MALSLWERTNLSLLINLVGKGFISLPLSDKKSRRVNNVKGGGRDVVIFCSPVTNKSIFYSREVKA